jgi:hypothetical protein
MNGQCFECGAPATCAHHVIPRSRGGTKTVPLCGGCHGLAHGLSRETWSDHRALTAAAKASMKARGLYVGGDAPYGYRVDSDGRLVPDEHEQAVKVAAAKLRAAGLSLRKIGAELAARGLVNRAGGTWSPTAVSRLLIDEAVA